MSLGGLQAPTDDYLQAFIHLRRSLENFTAQELTMLQNLSKDFRGFFWQNFIPVGLRKLSDSMQRYTHSSAGRSSIMS